MLRCENSQRDGASKGRDEEIVPAFLFSIRQLPLSPRKTTCPVPRPPSPSLSPCWPWAASWPPAAPRASRRPLPPPIRPMLPPASATPARSSAG
ncbi:conserved hypothetical protein [Herbaspirillum seropedicae SmR1]|uniref:Uncharacterized protein n=1 Tax=Herbaspirillum seropedicae (strain SmR1) TaxID=757424 RepID=D8IS66_HERSS|nr:conserved hypothetical protein [Herbaspirillum seropedicae SmR1]